MPTVRYGGADGQVLELDEDPDLVAIRTRSRRSVRELDVDPVRERVLDGLELVQSHRAAGVEVYRRRDSAAPAVPAITSTLRESGDVEFAGHVLVDHTSRQPVLYTENLFVKFVDDLSEQECRSILIQFDLTVKRRVEFADNAYFVEAPSGTGQRVFDIASSLLDRSEVELCHPELVREMGRRDVKRRQWHLAATMVDGRFIDQSVHAREAHDHATGRGVIIAVIDTGIDVDHEEFSSEGKIVAPWDSLTGGADPRPPSWSGERHGTACAGVACADGRFQASGVAPAARLMPIRLVQQQIGSIEEADALHWATEHGADVISCSWGPVDGDWTNPNDPTHHASVPLPDSTRLAIEHAATAGRNGLGCLIFWAAGNGGESVENDGWASHDAVFAIAACNAQGRRSAYSDHGPSIFCAFPSSDLRRIGPGRAVAVPPGIWTTDRTGAPGYAHGNYTGEFGGTSSACPGVAGVAALVLERAPELSLEEARTLLAGSCDRIDSANAAYDRRGHSEWYGFGRINAATAVARAIERGGGDIRPPDRTDRVEIVELRSSLSPVDDHLRVTITVAVPEGLTAGGDGERRALHFDLSCRSAGGRIVAVQSWQEQLDGAGVRVVTRDLPLPVRGVYELMTAAHVVSPRDTASGKQPIRIVR